MTAPSGLSSSTVAFYGVGSMGTALLEGLVRGGHPGERVVAVDRHPETLERLQEAYAVRPLPDPATASREADVHVVAVKPAGVPAVLGEIAPGLGEGDVVVSVAAGLTLEALESALPEGTAVVRVMPNTPALVGEGMAVLARGSACSDEALALAEAVLAASGRTLVLDEHLFDAVTGLSGSGPAYAFYVAEALVEGGVLLGLPRTTASTLAIQTLLGAATMLADGLESGEASATVLRERVCSPGGTTMAAIAELDERAVRAALVAAVRRSAERSAEMGR